MCCFHDSFLYISRSLTNFKMSTKTPDFESLEYDNADVLAEDARVDAWEAQLDADSQRGAALHAAAVQQAVSSCLSSCLACLDVLYLQRDARPFSEVAAAHSSWQQEAEPEPCSRDAWLRGALPEVVVPARVPAATPSSSNTASQRAGGRDAHARPGSGLLARSRKGPSSVASSAAADEGAGRLAAQRLQQSRRSSVTQSMKVTDSSSPAAAASSSSARSRPGTSTTTAQRPPSAAAGHASTPTTAAEAAPSRATTAQRLAGDSLTPGAAGAAASTPAVAAASTSADHAPPATAAPSAAARTAGRKQPSRVSLLSQEQQEAEDRLRQELQLRRQQEAVVKELKQKDEAARAALPNMQKDMKGRWGCLAPVFIRS